MVKKTQLPDKSADSAEKSAGELLERLLWDEISFQQKRRVSFLQSLVDAKVTPGDITSIPGGALRALKGHRGVPFPVMNDIANDLRDFERNQPLRPCWLWNTKVW